ncbi:hypothetical protein FRB90_005326, partial [Tulasnella sp. 427]
MQSGETGGHTHGEDEDIKSEAFDKDEEVKSRVSDDDEEAEYSDPNDKELIGQTLKQKVGASVVAVKQIRVEMDTDVERALAMALREADFLFELSHPNVVELEGFVEDVGNKTIWLVFPWAENGTLREFVASREWEIPERLALIHDVAHGVEYLHGQQPPIYHGDLKSVNILVNWLYRAVITDFGSARRLSEDKLVQRTKPSKDMKDHLINDQEEDQDSVQAQLTTSGDMMTLTGDKYTIRWAAPELLDEGLPTLSCDIWSLGWVAYEPTVRLLPRDLIGNLPPAFSLLHEAELSIHMGHMYKNQSDYDKAIVCLTKTLDLCTSVKYDPGRAAALFYLAEIHSFRGEYTDAFKGYSEAIELHFLNGNREGRADAL